MIMNSGYSKKQLTFWQIWNMSFGFLGIQFGFALQGGHMSRIFQTLGAAKDDIPMLWIAAPLTGLIVQPIIGYMSDRTWHPKLGRRRPFFLVGAVLASITLFFAPYSSALWMAVGSLWVLDASINISMEPFRALVADKLSEEQRSYGFIIQTLIIGIGTWVASKLPFMVKGVMDKMGIVEESVAGVIPSDVKIAFGIGAFIFIASILVTIFTTDEYPPEDMEAFKAEKANIGFFDGAKEIFDNILGMPKIMQKLGLVQFFSWFAFFTMWSMATPALTEHVFQTPFPTEGTAMYEQALAAFNESANLVGSYMGIYGLSSMLFAFVLTFITAKIRINRKLVHLVSLILGGIGFVLMFFIKDHQYLNLSFALIGFSWGSILSMPYAMLSSSIDEKKMGVYMGIFNMFIVIPQILAAIGGVNVSYMIFGNQTISTMLLAGTCLIIAGLCNLFITEKEAIR
jgi:maltose/moltooligosaccharide transporter